MGLYLRKGFNFGPLRLNLSRSGLGASFGVKGARIGVGPRGSYIHMGRGGLYYRQSLTSGNAHPENSTFPSSPKIDDKLQPNDVQVVASGAASQMADSSAADVLRELNRVKKRFDRFPLALIVGIGAVAALLVMGALWWEVLSVSVAACTLALYARHSDVIHGTAILRYDLDAESGNHFSQLKVVFGKITECGRVWHIEATGHTDDTKRHAGATSLVQRSKAEASFSKPPRVQCNIDVPTLRCGHKSLYFFPDHLLVYDSTGIGAVAYEQLEADGKDARYIEEEGVPRNATQVGTTWKYVNKSGGPDRRFNNNPQLPVMLYGLLALTSKSGLNEIFQCSTPVVPQQIAAALAQLGHMSETVPPKPQPPREAATPSEPKLPTGVYFCVVKGVTHSNDDGTSRSEAMQFCSIGDTVKLVPDPGNVHDADAMRVVLLSGQQIGYISARQSGRFAGKAHLLTATVHSRVKDEWGNDTIKLRVVNSQEQQAFQSHSASPKAQGPAVDTVVSAIQAEARETAKKEGWQSTFVYFENAERGLYQIFLAEDSEHMLGALREGFVRVGFIGGKDAPKGIDFGFELDDSFPVSGPVAKRFLENAREWVVARAKEVSAQKGLAAPVVHEFEFSKKFLDAQKDSTAENVAAPNSKT
jgi:hypothetical protein